MGELLRRSLIRARTCEQLADLVGMPGSANELFLAGMFSAIDALMDRPMEEILESLPLNEDVKLALLDHSGRFADPYDLAVAYESGQWDQFSELAAKLDVDESALPDIARKASKWAADALEAL